MFKENWTDGHRGNLWKLLIEAFIYNIIWNIDSGMLVAEEWRRGSGQQAWRCVNLSVTSRDLDRLTSPRLPPPRHLLDVNKEHTSPRLSHHPASRDQPTICCSLPSVPIARRRNECHYLYYFDSLFFLKRRPHFFYCASTRYLRRTSAGVSIGWV